MVLIMGNNCFGQVENKCSETLFLPYVKCYSKQEATTCKPVENKLVCNAWRITTLISSNESTCSWSDDLGATDVSPHGLQLCHVGLDGVGEGRLRDQLLHRLRQPDEDPAGHRTRVLTRWVSLHSYSVILHKETWHSKINLQILLWISLHRETHLWIFSVNFLGMFLWIS